MAIKFPHRGLSLHIFKFSGAECTYTVFETYYLYFTLLVHEMGQCFCHCTSVHCLFGYHSYSNYSGHLYQICRYAFSPSFRERIELCHFGRTFALLPKHFLPIGQTWYHCLWSSKVSMPLCSRNFQNVKLRLDTPILRVIKFWRSKYVIFDYFRGAEY